MKKLALILTSLALASLVLNMTLFTASHAAIGIPKEFQPQNVGLKDLNDALSKKVNSSSNQQDAAVKSINIVLQYVANLLLFIAAPLAVMFIVRAGSDYAFAMGEESKIEGAKRQLTWSLLGLTLIMFSYIIVRFVVQPFPLIQDANDKQVPTTVDWAAEQAAEQKNIEDNMEDSVEEL